MYNIILKIPTILMLVAPILITAIAGMICERSGVVNIALEGLMVIGAFVTAIVHYYCEFILGPVSPWLALLCGALAGMLFSLVHAYPSISMNSDQVISGTGINLISVGLAMFVSQLLFRETQTKEFRLGLMPGIGGVYPTTFIALAVVLLAWYILYKRPAGLHLRACGENPQAAAVAGLNVKKIRYIAVMTSGFLSGLAGGSLLLTANTQFTGTTVNGHGFIALAVVSFGRWSPLGVTLTSILFGSTLTFSIIANDFPIFRSVPSDMFNILPYLITLLALVIFSGKNHAPKSLGLPYETESS
ncbi:MAG: sugar ABC transporter permease [Treponema sp.]|nr:MAG: sugar ABC transporter permease [Treponema sp.]